MARTGFRAALPVLLTLILALSAAPPCAASDCDVRIEGDRLVATVPTGAFTFVEEASGELVELADGGRLCEPGRPILPARSFVFALPPGARVIGLEARGIDPVEIQGRHELVFAGPHLPFADREGDPLRTRLLAEWRDDVAAARLDDAAWPPERARLAGSGALRRYAWAAVTCYPFSYRAATGRLVRYDRIEVTLRFEQAEAPKSAPADRAAASSARRAEALFANYAAVAPLYAARAAADPSRETHNLVIIGGPEQAAAVTASGFVDWKAGLGFTPLVVQLDDPAIASQPGADLPARIRNFLRERYLEWGIEYVLLVGGQETLPQRYCYPDRSNHSHNPSNPNDGSGEVPTDYYYADLSAADGESWDLDGDGYYGERLQDQPDFAAEVAVGRIPVDDPARIEHTLRKTVRFEQDTGSWKRSALHAGGLYYVEGEGGDPAWDGATSLHYIQNDLMAGWTVSRYSEQGGLAPSTYPWSALTFAAIEQDWRTNRYGVVNWAAHGWTNSAARKVWSTDDGDGVPEANEITWPDFISTSSDLDDDYPGFVFSASCLVGMIETNHWGNLGVDLLTKPGWGASIGVAAATRIVWGALNWPTNPGGGESLCYEFNEWLIDGPDGPARGGDALYDSKLHCHLNYPLYGNIEWLNMYQFNYLGDPTLPLEGRDPTAVAQGVPAAALRARNHPNPFNPTTRFDFVLPRACRARLSIHDPAGREIAVLADGPFEAGEHRISWTPEASGSGIYLYRLEAAGRVCSGKCMLIK